MSDEKQLAMEIASHEQKNETTATNSEATNKTDAAAAGGMGFKKSCMASPHLKSWFLSVLFWGGIAIKLVCFFWRKQLCHCGSDDIMIHNDTFYDWDDYYSDYYTICFDNIFTAYSSDIAGICPPPCNFAFSWWCLGVLGGIYLIYWIETLCSSSRRYLSHSFATETVHQYVNRIKSYPPSIYWSVECYHYETRTRTVYYTDSNGNQQSRTETYQEKVVTWTNSMHYHFNSWMDTSAPLLGLENYKLTKITYTKTYTFANEATRNDYNYQWAKFKRENDRDAYQSTWQKFTVKDFTKKMLAEVEAGTKPCCLTLCFYLLWSFVGLTSCYRVWFGMIVGSRKKFTFVKQISI